MKSSWIVLALISLFSVTLVSVNRKSTIIAFWKGIVSNISEREFKLGTSVIMKEFSKRISKNGTLVEPMIYTNKETIIESLKKNEIDLLIIPTTLFFEIEHLDLIEFLAHGTIDGTLGGEYLIAVNKDSNINKIEDLKDKKIVIENEMTSGISKKWIEVLLSEKKLNKSVDFFSEITFVKKPLKAITPVLFGQIDACIINKRSFNVMNELNPQIGNKLKVIHTSLDYIQVVTAIRKNMPKKDKNLIAETIPTFNQYESSKELLILFRWEKIILENKKILKDTRVLYRKYKKAFKR